MALIVLYCIIPFYWMIVSSLRLPSEGRSTEFLPNPPSIENYKGVFAGQNNFGRSLINSLIVSGITTVLTLLFGIIAAYALARLAFTGQGTCVVAHHGVLDVPADHLDPSAAEDVLLDGAVRVVPALD